MCALKSVDIMDLSKKLLLPMQPAANDKSSLPPLNHFNFLALMQNHYSHLENQLGFIKLPPKATEHHDKHSAFECTTTTTPQLSQQSSKEPFTKAPKTSRDEDTKALKKLKDSIRMLPHRKRPFNYDSISDDEVSKSNSLNLSPVSLEGKDQPIDPLPASHNDSHSFSKIKNAYCNTFDSHLPAEMISKSVEHFIKKPSSKTIHYEAKFPAFENKFVPSFESTLNDHKTNADALSTGSNDSRTTRMSCGQVKDESYWEKRRKNNEAAKRSRDTRRQKEEDIAKTAQLLAEENLGLKAQIKILKNELNNLHSILFYHTRPANE